MESLIPPEFDLNLKGSSDEALKRWRDAVGKVVKNRRRRFRYAADLEKRSEAKEHMRRLRPRHVEDGWRDRTLKRVLTHMQGNKKRKVSYFRWDGAYKPHVRYVQLSHPLFTRITSNSHPTTNTTAFTTPISSH